MPRLMLTMVGALALLAAGCDSTNDAAAAPAAAAQPKKEDAAEKPEPKAKPKLEITNYVDEHLGPDRLHTSCEAIGYGKVGITPELTMPLELEGDPGLQVSIGPHQTTLGDDGKGTLTLELAPVMRGLLADLSLAGQTRVFPGSVSMPVVLEAEGGARVEDTMSFDPTATFLRFVELAANGPLLLEGEEPGEGGRRATMIRNESIEARVLGGPEDFRDVDLLAFGRSIKHEKECGPYGTGADRQSLLLVVWDKELMVVERRTGKKLGRKTFKASRKCPRSIRAGAGAGHADYDRAKISRWAESFLDEK